MTRTKKKRRAPIYGEGRGGVDRAQVKKDIAKAFRAPSPHGPGRVTSVTPFKAISAKSQAGKPLSPKDLQYMQKLAWTTIKQGQDTELQQAINIARD